MIVENTGYLSIEQVAEMMKNSEEFGIYRTNKGTEVLVQRTQIELNSLQLFFPKKDRLPWKTIEGKKIATCTKIFDSRTDDFKTLNFSGWNGQKQIISYQEYSVYDSNMSLKST